MEIINSIKLISEELDRLQEYTNNLGNSLSLVDLKICDLLHFIENNKINTKMTYRLVKELKGLRQERRKIKNDMQLSETFSKNQSKLVSIDNRKFLLQEMYKVNKRLDSEYKYRVYTEEELKELLMGE